MLTDAQSQQFASGIKANDGNNTRAIPHTVTADDLSDPGEPSYKYVVSRTGYYTYYYLPAYYNYIAPVYSEYYNYVPPYYNYTAPIYDTQAYGTGQYYYYTTGWIYSHPGRAYTYDQYTYNNSFVSTFGTSWCWYTYQTVGDWVVRNGFNYSTGYGVITINYYGGAADRYANNGSHYKTTRVYHQPAATNAYQFYRGYATIYATTARYDNDYNLYTYLFKRLFIYTQVYACGITYYNYTTPRYISTYTQSSYSSSSQYRVSYIEEKYAYYYYIKTAAYYAYTAPQYYYNSELVTPAYYEYIPSIQYTLPYYYYNLL